MRSTTTLIFLLLALLPLARAQQPEVLYPRIDQQEPRRYGDGILGLLAQADREMQRNQFVDAIRTYSAAVAQAPNLAEAYVRRAMAYRLIGEAAQAQEDYRQALRLDPVVVDVFAYGSPARRAGVLAMALDSTLFLTAPATVLGSYRRYLNQVSGPVAANLTAPSAFGSEAEAPVWTPARLEEALELVGRGNYLGALELLNGWPDDLETTALAFSLAGLVEWESGHPDLAETWWFMAAEADPALPFPYFHLSRDALANQEPETARRLLEETLQLDQAFVPARQDILAIGGLYAEAGSPEAWTRELSVYGSATAHLNRSLAYYQLGDYGSALADADQVLQLADPPQAAHFAWRGSLYLLTDQPHQAERDLSTALTRGADPAPILQNRGLARILARNRGAGCADLAASGETGNARADELWLSLCRF